MNLLLIKKNTSILTILGIDSIGGTSKITYDLSKEQFRSDYEENLHDALTHSRYNNASLVTNLSLKKIIPGSYQSDMDPDDLNKLYYNEQELFITLNNTTNRTQVLRLYPDGSYKNYLLPYPRNISKVGETCDRSSYLVDHKLVTAFINSRGLSVGIYDLDSGAYLRQWGPDARSLDSLVTSPLVFEKIEFNATMDIKEITVGKSDTIKTWDKFLKKMFGMPNLSIAANKTLNGNLDIYIGGLMVRESSGGMMGSMPVGGVGMGGVMLSGPSLGSMKPVSNYDEDQPKARKHYYLRAALRSNDLSKADLSKEALAYDRFSRKYLEILSMPWTNITRINKGSAFYLGYYMPDESRYLVFQYK
jgi:hypothetical protein